MSFFDEPGPDREDPLAPAQGCFNALVLVAGLALITYLLWRTFS